MPRSRRRRFVTPEGVDLQLELGGARGRAGAFLLDMAIQTAMLIFAAQVIRYTGFGDKAGLLQILWYLGAFALRNGYFILFELGGRGATPGKRAAGLRVVARDGARLSGGAVIARNAMRELEIFLPVQILFYLAFTGLFGTVLTVFALAWSGLFLVFPLLNRDRLRVGDLIAGTWVVRAGRARLAADLAEKAPPRDRHFGEAALSLYGEYELQTLEAVLRGGRRESMAVVAAAIRTKAGLADDGDDAAFLADYYAALCVRLERGMLMGRRRANKFAAPEPARVT